MRNILKNMIERLDVSMAFMQIMLVCEQLCLS
jgi:hypothetical protein